MGTELPSQSQEEKLGEVEEEEQEGREEVKEEEKNSEIRIRKGLDKDVYADISRTRVVGEELSR